MFELFATSVVFCFFLFRIQDNNCSPKANMTVLAHASMMVASILNYHTKFTNAYMIFVLISFWFKPSKMTQNAIPTSVGIACMTF